MKRITKVLTASILGFGMLCGVGVSIAKHNKTVEVAEALYSPSTIYSVSDTAEELTAYYSDISDSDTGTNLLSKLRSLNSSKYHKNFTYSNFGTSSTTSPYVYTDYPLGTTTTDSKGQVRGSSIASFYTKTTATSYNKEHVWPNSKGGNKVENDILMPRPTISSENSSRGNSFFVEGMNSSSGGWDPYTAGYDKATRGECARIILYCMVASSQLNLVASNTGSDNTMGNMNTLIKWHYEYSPSTYEMNRNNGAEYLQGNRNPFVDHPEYVARIWSNFNSTVSSLCAQNESMYDDWVPGTCSNYGTNDAAGEPSTGGEGGGESGGGESGGESGEQGGGVVGEVVTSNSKVANGDKVVIRTKESTPRGVTGYNGNNDATVSTTESAWKQYVVGSASSSGFTLYDESADDYITAVSSNGFKYGSASNCYVDSEGRLMCNNRYLCVNGTNYRFYTSYGSYTTFYVYLVSTSSGSGESGSGEGGGESGGTPEVTSITASVNKTFYVGDVISSSDITVKDNNNDSVVFSFANEGYQFTYADAASGGALTNKTFTNAISGADLTCSLTVQVQRKARIAPSAADTKTVLASDLPTAYSAQNTERTAASGVKFYAINLAHYSGSGKLQFKSGGGYFQTTQAMALNSLTIVGRETRELTVYGSTSSSSFTQTITGTSDVYDLSGYTYVKVINSTTGAAYCTSLSISVGSSDTAVNVANYIMYEDTNNQCETKFDIAKGYFNDLSASERSTFMSSDDYVIATARERLEAWAANQGESISLTGEGYVISDRGDFTFNEETNKNMTIVIAIISSMSLLSVGALLLVKRRKLRK